MFSKRMRIAVTIAATVLLTTSLTSCLSDTIPDPQPSLTSADPFVEPSPETEPSPEAFIVIAGIDTDGAHISASGYVTGVIEDGGHCEFVFSGISGNVIAERDGIADAKSTSCGTVQVPAESFVRGSWTVTLSYSSDAAETASEPVELEIP